MQTNTEIFNSDNTHWEYEDGRSYLVYDGSLEDLEQETHIPYDDLVNLLGEYEDESRSLQADLEEIELARRGDY